MHRQDCGQRKRHGFKRTTAGFPQYEEFQKGNCSGLGEIDTKAKEGIAKYQFILADLYNKGLCVTKNDERAVDWLKKSAKQG